MASLEVGDIVSCTVERIAGTVVFVKIHGLGKDLEGGIILSEIAPGRIRNLRDYVVPKKRIICKILRISGDRIDLSLRRVTPKEQKEIREEEKQEKSCKSVLKSVLGEKANDLIKNVLKNEKIYDFCERIKEDPRDLEKLTTKDESKKIQEILKVQKQKTYSIKKEIKVTTNAPNGLELIKNLLGKIKTEEAEVKYLSAGKYTLKTSSENPKTADNQLKELLAQLEKQAKKQELSFSIKEK